MDDLVLPHWVDLAWVFGVFALALVIFHIAFVLLWPLSGIQWKKVDYVWLPMALLGVIGGASSARQEIARQMVSTARSRLEFAASQVEDRIAFGQSPAICRSFIRSEFSPPPETFDRRQREFDQTCEWFRSVAGQVSKALFARGDVIRVEDLGTPPSIEGDNWAVSSLLDAIGRYNEAVSKVQQLSAAERRSENELVAAVVGPILVAIALALRITKVAGEIRLEGRTGKSSSG